MNLGLLKRLFVLAGISASVSFVLVMIGILVLAGMQSPTQGMTYGFTPEMLSNPVFVEHHVKAFGWLFAAGYLSGLIMMWLDHRRSSHSD